MGYIPQARLNTMALGHFFRLAQTDGPGATEEDLVEAFKGYVGSMRVSIALDALKDNDYIHDIDPDNIEFIYGITKSGYKKGEEFYLKPSSRFVDIVEKGLEEYFSTLSDDSDASADKEIPASNRFVTISDNMPGYSELLETVIAANESVRGSNSVEAEEKSWIKVHIDLGIELLKKGGRVLSSALKSLLLEPLEDVLKENSEEGLRLAISTAIKAIKTYLGI